MSPSRMPEIPSPERPLKTTVEIAMEENPAPRQASAVANAKSPAPEKKDWFDRIISMGYLFFVTAIWVLASMAAHRADSALKLSKATQGMAEQGLKTIAASKELAELAFKKAQAAEIAVGFLVPKESMLTNGFTNTNALPTITNFEIWIYPDRQNHFEIEGKKPPKKRDLIARD